jgi:hypothetical protein
MCLAYGQCQMSSGRHTDAAIQRAIEQGQHNARIVSLVQRHCAHARIDIVGGVGLVEEQTGLPIGMRAVRCQHADHHGFTGANFEPVAVNFFKKNCLGCPYHKPIAGPPNLASHVRALDEVAERRRDAEERERRARMGVYERRAAQRHLGAQGEPYPTRTLLHKLDLIDAENPDDSVAQQIVESARGVPDLFTPRAVEILINTAKTTGNRRLVEALRWLTHRDRVEAADIVALAVNILSTSALAEAAHVLLDFRRALTAADVAPTHASLIRLAGRMARYSLAEPAAMLMAAEIDLPGALEALHELLASDSDYTRGLAASAAELLIEQNREVIPVLCRAIAIALRHPEAHDRLGGEDHSGTAIEQTLSAALVIAPEAARGAIESAALELDEDGRVQLFAAYDDVVRRQLGEPVPPAAGDVVARAALQRMTGDWGMEVADRASDTLVICGKYHPHLLVSHVDALVGAMLREIGRAVEPYHPLLDLSPQPNPLKSLEADTEQIRRNGRLSDLRHALSGVVLVAPDKVGEHIFALLDAPDVDVEEVKETRALAVRLLGPVGRHPKWTSRTIPYLYTALLSNDNLRRARAIEAWEELARPSDRHLPAELDALIETLLADPYVIVHKAMIRALWDGLPVSPGRALDIALLLVQIADGYANQSDLGETSYRALEAARRLGRQLGPKGHELIIEYVLLTAEKLPPGRLVYLLRHLTDELTNRPRYADRLLDVLCSDDQLSREDEVINDLVHVPGPQIAERVARVELAAGKDLPDNPWRVHRYVEVLQLAGEWDAAVRVTTTAEAAVQDTTENRRIRRRVTAIRIGAEFEAALARNDADAAGELALQWEAAIDAWEQAQTTFDPLTDLGDLAF